MSYGYIYKTTNLRNGNIYVGQHIGEFDPSYLGSGNILRLAIKKYGRSAFKVIPLAFADTRQEIDALEKHHIADQKSKLARAKIYNISPGGTGGKVYLVHPMLGKHHSEQARALFRLRTGPLHPNYGKDFTGSNNPHFGRKHKEETKKLIGKKLSLNKGPNHGLFGRKRSPEHCRKNSLGHMGQKAWNDGVPCSEETKKKIGDANRGKKHPPRSEECRRKISLARKKYWADRRVDLLS